MSRGISGRVVGTNVSTKTFRAVHVPSLGLYGVYHQGAYSWSRLQNRPMLDICIEVIFKILLVGVLISISRPVAENGMP